MASASDVVVLSLSRGGETLIECDGDHAAGREDMRVGLAWDFFEGGKKVDLDASCVCFDQMGVLVDAWCVQLYSAAVLLVSLALSFLTSLPRAAFASGYHSIAPQFLQQPERMWRRTHALGRLCRRHGRGLRRDHHVRPRHAAAPMCR